MVRPLPQVHQRLVSEDALQKTLTMFLEDPPHPAYLNDIDSGEIVSTLR